MRLRAPLLLIVLAITATAQVTLQPASLSQRDRAIALVQQDNIPEAIRLLTAWVKQNKKDVRAWHWLGLALEKQHNRADALKAYEQAAKTAYQLQTAAIDNLTSLAKPELLEAADSADRFLLLGGSLSEKKKKEWRAGAEFLRLQASGSAQNDSVYKISDVTTKPQVLSKPTPDYTEEARRNKVYGTVVLRCVFGADGRIPALAVLSGLPDGLTEQAIAAAKQIKFVPATKDGKPVSVWMQLEYNFYTG